jgi:biotin carboxyl carrier protein
LQTTSAWGVELQYEVEVNGRVRRVSLERSGERFAVSIDGRTRHVDVAGAGSSSREARTLSLIVEPGTVYDVGISPGAAGSLIVRIGSVHCAVALTSGRRRGRGAEREHAASGPQRIVAPMPGKVVRVAVAPGDAVRARQTIVVIEAMKMENELRAGRDGIVAELHAKPGAPVEPGELLAVIQ